MPHNRPSMASIMLAAILALGAHPALAQGKAVQQLSFATSDDLYAGEVRLAECEDAKGEVQRLPSPVKPAGFGAWLHTADAFSIRTRFWSDINRRLKDRPRPEEPADFDNLPPDEEGRRTILAQVVIGLVVDGEVRLLVPNRENGRPLYRIACRPDQPLRAPDLYPTVEVKATFPQNRADGEHAAAFQRLLQALRGEARAGRSLPFFAAAAPSPLPPHTRPLSARERTAYIDFTVAALEQKQALFLTRLAESGSLRLMGVGGRAPGSTQVSIERPPNADGTPPASMAATDRTGPGAAPAEQPAQAIQDSAQDTRSATEIHLKRQLEAAQVSAGELMREREELREQLARARRDLEERGKAVEEHAARKAALEEQIHTLAGMIEAADETGTPAPQLLAQRLQALGAEADRLRGESAGLLQQVESLRLSKEEAVRQTEALNRELADVARSHRAMSDSLQQQDEQLKQARHELMESSRDRDEARRTLAAPGLRVRLPDEFASVDFQEQLRITDGPCRGAVLHRMPDRVSYESKGCTEIGGKTLGFGDAGLKPVALAGLTADLRLFRPSLSLRLSGAAERKWFEHRGGERKPMLIAEDVAFQDVFPGGEGRLRLRMFPEAAAGSALDRLCAVEIAVTPEDVRRGEVAVREDPPCDAYPVAGLPPDWFVAPPSSAGDPHGQPFCLAPPTAAIAWCAKRRGDTSAVTLSPGAGWVEQAIPADALSWSKVRIGLRAVWPYAGPNPAPPDLPDRPDYRLSGVRYCLADASSCCTVPADGAQPQAMVLPALGDEAACAGPFAPDRLPATVQPTFEQPADAASAALAYWPRYTDDPIEVSSLRAEAPRVAAADRLVGRYPVVAAKQPFLPFAATNRIHFHNDGTTCRAQPTAGIRPGVPYRAGGGALGFNSDARSLFAVLTDGNRALSHCVRAEAQRDPGAPGGVRTAIRFTVRAVPGRPAIVSVLPSERLGADGRGAAIRRALGDWLKRKSVAAASPLRVLAIDPDGAVRDVVTSGSLVTDVDRIAGVVDEALAGLGFAGPPRNPLQAVQAVYRHLEAEQADGGQEPMAGLVLISDGSEPALRRSDLLTMLAVASADRSAVGIATPGGCANWTRFDAVPPGNCLELNGGADDVAGKLLRFLEAMQPPPNGSGRP